MKVRTIPDEHYIVDYKFTTIRFMECYFTPILFISRLSYSKNV